MARGSEAANRSRDAVISFLVWGVAAASMVCDHVGVIFFPDVWEFRAVGRLAWPLFAMLAGRGAVLSPTPWRFAARCGLFAGLSAVPHWWAFGSTGSANIFATLALGVSAVAAVRCLPDRPWDLLCVAVASTWLPVEYGAAGVAQVAGWAVFFRMLPVNLGRARWTGFRWWFYPAHLVVLAAIRGFA